MGTTWIALAIILIGGLWLVSSDRLSARHYVYIAVAVLAVLVIEPLVVEMRSANGAMWHAAPFFGSVLITIGWIVTSEINIKNSRRQHTITLITQHAFDPKRAENRDTIRKYLPTFETPLLSSMVDFDSEANELLKAIDLELNFYEFLAVGAHRGELDEQLIRECLHTQFCKFYEQTQYYVSHWQQKGSSSTWSHLSKMYLRWSQGKPPDAR